MNSPEEKPSNPLKRSVSEMSCDPSPSPSSNPKDFISITESKDSGSCAGTTKRKELHGTTCIRALSGSWADRLEGGIFHAYRIVFTCSITNQVYSGFILLIESKLDNDVNDMELELYLRKKTAKASVSSCGEVNLDVEQMRKAKCFQEFFFNCLFGRLFARSKSSGSRREFLLQNKPSSLWSPTKLYLLLPLENTLSNGWEINWAAIDASSCAVEFLKRNSSLEVERSNNDRDDTLINRCSSSERGCGDKNIIHLANSSTDRDSLNDMVVAAIHTGRMYSIVELLDDTSAESPFEGNTDGVQSEYGTFSEYFGKKYGIVLNYPRQPLLLLKQSHNPYNLLVNFSDKGAAAKAGLCTNKPLNYARMPPELLLGINVPISVLKSFYLLPSLMHRLESLMLAGQLREEINCCLSDFYISSSLILEALTTLRCCESFSMERLELLGDSVLKYAVSCHLFLRYPEKHEGQLSDQRSRAVCNSMLHKLGSERNLQVKNDDCFGILSHYSLTRGLRQKRASGGYIRDSAFEPRRWVAPGQQSLHPVPCGCGIDTLEVPLDPKFQTEDPKVVLGKTCDKGHRWMVSKSISDCVEALIGAYYLSGGLAAALHVMKWVGVEVETDAALLLEVINYASLQSHTLTDEEINILESKLAYTFSVKFLMQEALVHVSALKSYCYERLEFLGDSVLDLLVTQHLFQNHSDIDPGDLTDLRSASVNNENFAQVAVRHDLHKHLQHCSDLLSSQIAEYLKFFPEPKDASGSCPATVGPKALGDMVESLSGAILIDTRLNLDEVWRIFKPLLSPIVTPDKLELPPFRELHELCDSLGYFIDENCVRKGEMVHAELRLQLEDELLLGHGSDRIRKAAKGRAASYLLKELESRGIAQTTHRRRRGPDYCGDSDQTTKYSTSEPPVCKKQKRASSGDSSVAGASPVIGTISTKKGGPRNSLFELCKRLLWPMPTFETTEQKSRTLVEFGEGAERRTGFNSFTSHISLHIPGYGTIECTGEARADKKSSFDSAALVMLLELQAQGKLKIGEA